MEAKRERFEELKHTDRLPSPTGVGMKILVLTQEDECSLDAIAETIQADPALTGRIIKLASSAAMAGSVPIATAKEAAMRLGLRTVTSVALGFSLVAGNRSGRCKAFDYEEYWSWSLANAVAAAALCRRFRLGIAEEFFTCGLLARVGELALASVHPAEYTEIVEHLAAHPETVLADVEFDQFGIDNHEVAAVMLDDWGLPASFSMAVSALTSRRENGALSDELASDLHRVLGFSAVFADLCVRHASDALAWGRLDAASAGFGLVGDDLRALLETVTAEWDEWGRMLDVETRPVPSYEVLHSQNASTERTVAGPVDQPSAATAELGGLRVLAVDDDPVSLRILVRHLERAGHVVMTARDGQEAQALALRTNPQIVVTDWMMPKMDGLELCRSLRRIWTGRSVYILILTGRDEEDRVVEAFDAGADDYVSKPYPPKVLLARIRGGERVVRLQEERDQSLASLREANARLHMQERKLRAWAMTDPLTRMRNRRYAMERLEKEWASSERAEQPFSVVMLDIDRFKAINDTYGHAVGDAVLQATAGAIERTLRGGDTAARIGGEEFLVICPNTDAEGARRVAERIRASIEENRIAFDDYDGNVTVSLGVGTRDSATRSFDELLRLADKGVYQAKRAGRNRTEIGLADDDHRKSA